MQSERTGRLASWYQSSNFHSVFNFSDDRSKGRCYMILAAISTQIVTALSMGVFYTGFLLENGIDIVNIGILGFLPNIAAIFTILSSRVLEYIRRRKPLLLAIRGLYHFLLVGAITLMPFLGLPQEWKAPALMVIVFLGHSCNAFSAPGIFVWNKQMLPDDIRPKYLGFSGMIAGIVNSVTLVLSGFLADFLKASGEAMLGMVIIRVIAIVFAVVDILILSRIKEFPYETSSEKIRVKDIFLLPLRNKKFRLTMCILFFWGVIAIHVTAPVSAYLLDTVGISYTFINTFSMLYLVSLLLTTSFWQKTYAKLGMMKTVLLTYAMVTPFHFLFGFVAADNYMWMYPIVYIGFYIGNVGLNMSTANLPYAHMPKQNETCYSSFYLLISNFSSCFGQILCTFFISITQDWKLQIGTWSFTNVQIMLCLQGLLMVVLVIMIRILTPTLSTKEDGTAL